MAQRRMFSKKVTDTDIFLDMPLSAQALYFHLNMHADDDGFIGNINTIKRMVGASNDDEKLLIAKQLLIPFEQSGVVVIRDWRIHNYIRKDTYNQTMYTQELDRLGIDDNGKYHVDDPSTVRPRIVDTGKVRVGKDRLVKSKGRLEVGKAEEATTTATAHEDLGQAIDETGFALILQPIQIENLYAYVEDDGLEIGVVIKALEEASDNGKRNYNYVRAILEDKVKNGITTVAKWNASKQDYKEKRQSNQVPTNDDNAEWAREMEAHWRGEV
ncbi:DnaD domain-containing protein [Weissella thailandensis]|uniref:DnaD domain protein n=1 Tax=Weissella thailandensis TaxID=89061 RepID=A0ABX9I4P1_9LACO|nr:DnaD domain protein [Weissella thailandensis]NKY90838.1 DnaD domain protein [Weissella thailandensis]RDS59656.1 DnaD domain protein [Weissella thailandensis]GEP75490.1 DNA replication protein [Weissella thailandensis]